MKCEYARLFLHELADKQLTIEQSIPVRQHLQECSHCQKQLRAIKDTKKQLTSIELADNIPDTFIDSAIAYAQYRHEHSKKPFPRKKANMQFFAIAASFVFAFILGFTLFKPEQINHTIVVEQEEVINVLFDAPRALENVTFTVTLPDNLEMQGFPGSKQISWRGTIQQGKNLLSIPITGNNRLEGVITTELQHHDSKRLFKINIKKDKHSRQLI